MSGSGNLTVKALSSIAINRHFSLTGTCSIAAEANVDVAKEIMFDVGIFDLVSCPQ